MHILKSIIDEIRKRGIDIYLALALGIIATIIGVLGAPTDIIVDVTSGVLALIAFTLFRDRDSVNQLKDSIQNIEKKFDAESTFKFRDFHSEVKRLINLSQNEIYIMALTADSLATVYSVEMEQALKRGCHIKVIVANHSHELVSALAYRKHENYDKKDVKADFEITKRYIKRTQSNIEAQNFQGSIELRTINYLPPYIIIISDPETQHSNLITFLITFRLSLTQSPSIKLSKSDENDKNKDFLFFHQQMKTFWEASKSIEAN